MKHHAAYLMNDDEPTKLGDYPIVSTYTDPDDTRMKTYDIGDNVSVFVANGEWTVMKQDDGAIYSWPDAKKIMDRIRFMEQAKSADWKIAHERAWV